MSKQTSPAPTFADWLDEYGSGALNDRLTAALREVAESVILYDKAGKVTLTLAISAKGGGVIVSPSVKAAPPEGKEGGQFFYVASDGSLSRRDPNQPQLTRPDTGAPADPMWVGPNTTTPTPTTEDRQS
jgi:hypothetical protein